jgi:Cu/Ag efflux protein CusF
MRNEGTLPHCPACESLIEEMIMLIQRLLLSILVATPLAMPFPALAQGSPTASGQPKASAPSTAWTEGVVRTIHKQEGQITISHEPLANLGMGKMTMTFRLKNPALIEGIKEGSKIRFIAEDVKGELTVVALQAVK